MTREVTVVIPVHDRADVIGEALASALDQTRPPEAIVVVDDGSTDATGQVVSTLADQHPSITLIRQPNRGPSAARNAGLAAVTTELVTFLDSDDLMWPARIETQVRHLEEHPEVDIVIGREHIEMAEGVPEPRWVRELPPAEVFPRYYTMSMLLERRWIDQVGGFDESIRVGEDVDLIVRLRAAGAAVAMLDEVFITRRIRGDNLIFNEDDVASSMLRALRRHLPEARHVARPASD